MFIPKGCGLPRIFFQHVDVGRGASGGSAAEVVEVTAVHFFGKWLFPLTIDMHITMYSF